MANAQKSVDAAKAALNGSSASEAASNQAKAQSAFDAATAAEKKAQEELAAAQAADKEKATAISAKEGQLTADQNAANQAKAAYETAQTVANEKAAALAAAEAAKKKAESSTTSTANVRQKFSVSQEYVNALKIHESKTATAAEKAQAEQVLKNVNKRDRGNNSYQDNEADKNVKISDLNTEPRAAARRMWRALSMNKAWARWSIPPGHLCAHTRRKAVSRRIMLWPPAGKPYACATTSPPPLFAYNRATGGVS